MGLVSSGNYDWPGYSFSELNYPDKISPLTQSY